MLARSMVRGLMSVTIRMKTTSLVLFLTAFAMTRGSADTITFTTPGEGSVTVPAGDEWTNVTVQCWSGGGGGGGYSGGGGGGGAYGETTYSSLATGSYAYYVGGGGARGFVGDQSPSGPGYGWPGSYTAWNTPTNQSSYDPALFTF